MCIGYEGLFQAFRFLQKYKEGKDNIEHREFSIE